MSDPGPSPPRGHDPPGPRKDLCTQGKESSDHVGGGTIIIYPNDPVRWMGWTSAVKMIFYFDVTESPRLGTVPAPMELPESDRGEGV